MVLATKTILIVSVKCANVGRVGVYKITTQNTIKRNLKTLTIKFYILYQLRYLPNIILIHNRYLFIMTPRYIKTIRTLAVQSTETCLV